MEIPDSDELQWLEANSHIQEQEEDDYVELEVEGGGAEGNDEDEHFGSSDVTAKNKKRPRCSLELDREIDGDKLARVNCTQAIYHSCHNNSKCLSRYASEIDGDFVPVTAPSGSGCGDRIYAKLDKQIFPGGDVNVNKFKLSANDSGLVSEPVNVLLQKAEQDALMKALQASSAAQNALVLPETSLVTGELWVNKYAPRSFTELLSDEQTNREVLTWLKQWDSAVFGSDIRNTRDEVLSALRRHSSHPHHQKHFDGSFLRRKGGPQFAEKDAGHSAMSEQENFRAKGVEGLKNKKENGSGIPDQKVLLLCGPPGLGKTTLAHVAAKHCGYDVVEINASDDRSSTTIEAKILDAVQMNSVMADSKPKCLVIDEIDGSLGEGKGAVEVILRMVTAERKAYVVKEASALEEQHGKKSLNRGRKAVSLSRPVICICNDLYAPSLRTLRQMAKVLVFAHPTVNRVVSRLKYICKEEGLRTSSIALTSLAEYTECDIRSCLNTLQFIHKKKESLNLVTLSSQVIGRKDMTRSIFDVWREVFQKRKVNRRLKCDASPVKTYDTYDSLYSLISNRGDYELILDGIHENFLQLHYHDPVLQKTVRCLDALGIFDLLHQCVMRLHNMSLYAYYPPITITIHQLLARVERPTIEWPKSFQRYRSLLMEKMEILRSWQSKIAACISRHLSVNSFIEDTVSPLLHILSPADLRPVAVQLLSEKEKNDLAQLISTMVSYSITYKTTKCDTLANKSTHDRMMDSSSVSLDPPIQDFVNFKDYKPGHHELKSAVKQVLLHEVEKQKIVRESTGRFMHSPDRSRQDSNSASNKQNGLPQSSKVHERASVYYSKEGIKSMSQQDICKPNVHRCSSSPGFGGTSADVRKLKSTGKVEKPSIGSFNFFDRFKKLNSKGLHDIDSSEEKPATAARDDRALLFKFNEGFTNAVKRPVRIREFLI